MGRNLSKESSTEKKPPEFASETNESVISFLSSKCGLSCAESCDIISWCLTVSVKRRCCRRAWTRKKDSSTMAKNNPRKFVFLNRDLHLCIQQTIGTGSRVL